MYLQMLIMYWNKNFEYPYDFVIGGFKFCILSFIKNTFYISKSRIT